MDKARVVYLREELQVVLDEFAKKHNLEEVGLGNVQYDHTGFKTSLKAKAKLSYHEKSKELDKKAMRMGLPEGIYGKTIYASGKEFKVTDINTRARKYPIIGEDEEGKRYKFPRQVLDKVEPIW